MKSKLSQDIPKRFLKNILFIQGVSFVLIVIAIVFATYFLKIELANQVASSIEGKVNRGDMREVMFLLSDARKNHFTALELYDRADQIQFTFPTQFRKNTSPLRKLIRDFSLSTYSKGIFFDSEGTKKAATLVFTFNVFQFFPLAVIIFGFGMLISYPFYRRHHRLLLDSLEKETAQRQSEAIEELARQVRHDYKSPLIAMKSVIDKPQNLGDSDKQMLSSVYNRMMSMLNDLSKENIQKVLECSFQIDQVRDCEPKALTHIYSSVLSVVQEKSFHHQNLVHSSDIGSIDPSNQEKSITGRHRGSNEIFIQISCSGDDKRAYSIVDDTDIQRVLSNIIENSIESFKNRSLTEGREISIKIKISDSIFMISVTDNGCGIPESLLNKVTNKGVSFGKEGGEGLGLYSSSKNLEKWGGKLEDTISFWARNHSYN